MRFPEEDDAQIKLQRPPGRHFALTGHHRQKSLDFAGSPVTRMGHAAGLRGASADEKACPVQVGFFGLQAMVKWLAYEDLLCIGISDRSAG